MSKFLLFATLILLLSSCIHHRELVNFNEGPEFAAMKGDSLQYQALRLQPDDLLSISVQSVDPVASAPFNMMAVSVNGSTAPGAATQTPLSYLIDANGNIDFPMIGTVKAAGLTTSQLRDTLYVRTSNYITKPIVNVRLLNFRFSISGEVQHGGTFTGGTEKVDILQAIGMAGDLTNYANRERILLIREENGQREFVYLNLHQRDIFRSPYFYLQQNDHIYVEPLPAKVGATTDGSNKFIQWAFPLVSIVSLIVTLTR